MDMKVPENIKELHEQLKVAHTAYEKALGEAREVDAKAEVEIKRLGTITGETNAELKKTGEALKPLSDGLDDAKARLHEVEQKLAKGLGGATLEQIKSPGQIFTDSAEYKQMVEERGVKSRPVSVGSL